MRNECNIHEQSRRNRRENCGIMHDRLAIDHVASFVWRLLPLCLRGGVSSGRGECEGVSKMRAVEEGLMDDLLAI